MQYNQIDELAEILQLPVDWLRPLEAIPDALEMTIERLNIIKHKLKFVDRSQRPEVMLLQDLDTLPGTVERTMKALVEVAGGIYYAWSYAPFLNPDKLLVSAKKGTIKQLLVDVPSFISSQEWHDSKAVKEGQLYLINGQRFISGDLTLLADEAELLAEIIFPQYFVYGGEGENWIKFEL